MSVKVGLLVFTCVLPLWASKQAKWSPLTVSLWLWAGIMVLQALDPLQLHIVTIGAALIIGVGLLAMSLPLWKRHAPSDVSLAPQGHGGVAFARLVITSAAVLVMVAIGVYAFREGISSATGAGYGALSIQQIRAAQTGSARGGGLLGLFSAADPMLACLGVYGVLRYSRFWLLLVILAFLASLQTPARLTTLTLLVTTVVFYLYLRNVVPARLGKKRIKAFRRPPGLLILMAGAAGVWFFNVLGSRLGKNELAAGFFPDYIGPDWLLSPILYFTGGMPALSVALQSSGSPIDFPNSLFSVWRVANFMDPSILVPDTLGKFVPIPIPFNVYTGFGQIYFDFGYVGVVVMAFALGWFAVTAHRKACQGFIEWAWVSAIIAGLLLSLPQAYRLFFLDVNFQLVVGFAVFWHIRRSRKQGQSGFGLLELRSDVVRRGNIPASLERPPLGSGDHLLAPTVVESVMRK